MPIVPRYDSTEREIPVPEIPIAPYNTSLPEIMKSVSRIAHDVEGSLTIMQARRQLADDTAEIAKRMMGAQTFIDDTTDAIKKSPDLRKNAPQEYEKAVSKQADTWTKGLDVDVAATLSKSVPPRTARKRKKA